MDIQVSLNKEEILSIVSELEIFKYYCSNFREVDIPFSSELREDPKPSCRISLMGDYYLYKDFGETTSHNCFGYIMRKYNLDYNDALAKICNDFNLLEVYINTNSSKIYKSVVKQKKHKVKDTIDTIIKIKKRDWLPIDSKFWYDKYGITQSTLEKYKVSPLSYFWIIKGDVNRMYSCGISNVYSYYYYKDSCHRYKIYSPYNKKNKWFSNINGSVVQGIKNIPKTGEILIISKSLKDIMCLYELGYNAVAGNNETAFIPEINIEKFKKRYKNIYVWFDSDLTGLTNGKIFAEKYNLKAVFNPPGEPKDISDIISLKGQSYALNIINKLIV